MVDVAPLPDPINSFSSDIKVYTAKVRIDDPLSGLKPGMTARVEVLVSERDNVLSVPVEAIIRYDDKDHLVVKNPSVGLSGARWLSDSPTTGSSRLSRGLRATKSW